MTTTLQNLTKGGFGSSWNAGDSFINAGSDVDSLNGLVVYAGQLGLAIVFTNETKH